MVHFYKGNTLKHLADAILAAIPQDGTGEHVVLVPDRFTLSIEQKLAERGALLNVEVLPFSRFARRTLGAQARDCLTPEGCTMLLSKAIEGCRDQLTYYRGALDGEGFVNEMYSALVAVRNSGVTSARLIAAAEGMKGRVADKTRDIAKMMDAYLQTLSTSHTDPTTLLEALAKAIPHDSAIAKTSFYFVGFYCFNKVQYEVIEQLIAYAKAVHLGYIAEDVGEDNRRIFPSDMAAALQDMARRQGVFCQTTPAYEPLLPAKRALQDHLFGYKDDVQPEPVCEEAKASIRLFCERGLREELQTVCAEICSLLRKGYRYRDIAIISADPDSIGEVLQEVFDDYRIPVFRDRKVLLSKEPLVRFVLDGIAVGQDWEWDKVMAFVKNPLFGATSQEVDEFENYCRKYAINYSRFASPFTLQSPRGEDDLALAESVRARLVASALNTEGCKTVHDFVAAIRAYQVERGLDARFAEFYQKQASCSPFGAQRSQQVPDKWNGLLDSFDRLLGEETVDEEGFLRLFRSALESVKISLLPSSLDQVYIGEAKDSHYDGVKVMFVVDAVDGKLPLLPEAGSILSDAYYRALQLGDVVVYPSVKDQGRYSRFYLEQLLLMPERLYVSFAGSDLAAQAQRPSAVVESLSKLFGLEVTQGLGHSLIERVSNRANAYKVLLRERDKLAEGDVQSLEAVLEKEAHARYVAVLTPVSEGLVHTQIFFRRELTSVSQLETFFSCPYRHFVQYGLGATERKEAKVDANETGNVIHKVLEILLGSIDVDAISDKEVDERIEAAIEVAIGDSRLAALTGKEYASRLERLKGECRYIAKTEVALVKASKFRPMGTEIRFGGTQATYPAIDLVDGVRLKGTIDRVDLCQDEALGDMVSVVDYKSGNAHPELKYVYYGYKFQLYAYLGALRAKGYVPVGAFYKKASGRYRSAGDLVPPMAFKGQAVDDSRVLLLFEPELSQEARGKLLPVKWGKEGLVSVESKSFNPLPQGGIEQIIDYTIDLMKEGVSDIREGYIDANPIFEACKYCKAAAMCPEGRMTAVRQDTSVGLDAFVQQPQEGEEVQA